MFLGEQSTQSLEETGLTNYDSVESASRCFECCEPDVEVCHVLVGVRAHHCLEVDSGASTAGNELTNFCPAQRVIGGNGVASADVIPVRCGERGFQIKHSLCSHCSII